MAVIKCKMCGGDLVLIEGQSVAECEYCGSRQTVPAADNEKKLTLFARANRLRFACEFDKAAGVYESIVGEFDEEAEAYWGLVLCKYGIEYVDDPATGKKIPTCHRTSFDSILEDSDFEQALENADPVARRIYREEAKQIEELRKGIIQVSSNEDPYDIFICYKETDENESRTLDSVLAQDIYDALTAKGYRTFFARITLEDKLGEEYEPYIFAALNSAKIMLAIGTDYEYYNAVWVKNEWSRFLKLMIADKTKHLIPCYKGIDAYDMPREFARLQAQDLGKVGAIQDLLRGVAKLISKQIQDRVEVPTPMPGASAMVMRGQFALDDGDFVKAAEYFERALDQNPQDGNAYLGKVLAFLGISKAEQIEEIMVDVRNNKDYERAIRFVDPVLSKKLVDLRERACKKHMIVLLNNALINIYKQKYDAYYKAVRYMSIQAATEEDFLKAAEMFREFFGSWRAVERHEECLELVRQKHAEQMEAERKAIEEQREAERKAAEEKARKLEETYQKNCRCLEEWPLIHRLLTAADELEKLGDYKDSREMAKKCRDKAEQLEKDMLIDEQYQTACVRMDRDEIQEVRQACRIFEQLEDWKDARNMVVQCERKIQKLEYRDRLYAEELALMSEKNKLRLFSGKRRREIEIRLSEIETELKGLK